METEKIKYEITQTSTFGRWLKKLSPEQRPHIATRLANVKRGEFGDTKHLRDGLWELRFMGGVVSGLRIYYTFRNQQLILICEGGDKDSQSRDITRALEIIKEVTKNEK